MARTMFYFAAIIAISAGQAVPEITSDGADVRITPGVGGEIRLGSGTCTAGSVCDLVDLVNRLGRQLNNTKQTVNRLSRQLAAQTPEAIAQANGQHTMQGTWNGVDTNAVIPIGAMGMQDVLQYSIAMVGCNGGRAQETGILTVVTPGETNRTTNVVTRQPVVATQVMSRTQRNLWVHLVNFYVQQVPGVGGRTMIYLKPGQDCNVENINQLTGQCNRPATGLVCNRAPNYNIKIQSLGGQTGNQTFVVASQTPGGWGQQTFTPQANPVLQRVAKTVTGLKMGTFPQDTQADILSLGSMKVNDIVKFFVSFDACGATSAAEITVVGAPYQRGKPSAFEIYALSTRRNGRGIGAVGLIPTLLDKLNFYVAPEPATGTANPSRAQLYLELEPLSSNCRGSIHKYVLDAESSRGDYDPSSTLPFNRSAAVMTVPRLLGRATDGRHPWSPAPSCQTLYESQGFTTSGWYYVVDPLRATPSYRPAKYVRCTVTSVASPSSPIVVQPFGYRRVVIPNNPSQTAAQASCRSNFGSSADLASFTVQSQYDAIVSELQTNVQGGNSPILRWWIGLMHNTTRPWGAGNPANWYFTDGTSDRSVRLLWESPPVSPNACVTARLTTDAGSRNIGSGGTWTGPDSLSLAASDCSSPTGIRIGGALCFGQLPEYAGAT